jgi:hypothetical protein
MHFFMSTVSYSKATAITDTYQAKKGSIELREKEEEKTTGFWYCY